MRGVKGAALWRCRGGDRVNEGRQIVGRKVKRSTARKQIDNIQVVKLRLLSTNQTVVHILQPHEKHGVNC